jgi:hypothetical protein
MWLKFKHSFYLPDLQLPYLLRQKTIFDNTMTFLRVKNKRKFLTLWDSHTKSAIDYNMEW